MKHQSTPEPDLPFGGITPLQFVALYPMTLQTFYNLVKAGEIEIRKIGRKT